MFGYGPNLAGGSSMSNCKPRVTIGLAVYNGERFLEQTLDSLLEQSYADFELIIALFKSESKVTFGTKLCGLRAHHFG